MEQIKKFRKLNVNNLNLTNILSCGKNQVEALYKINFMIKMDEPD